tara:strand:+ start:38190 stop:38366 length:177 start_codon:yes stop_codon:yes gene_type:complete
MESMEAGLVEAAEEEALPNAPLAPAIPLIEQKSVKPGKKDSSGASSSGQKQKRPAQAV